MRASAAVVMAAVAIAAGSVAQAAGVVGGVSVPKSSKCEHVTAKAFKPFSEKAWRLSAWERGKPPKRVIRAQRKKLKCAVGPRHRAAMKRHWKSDKEAFYKHRGKKLRQQAYLEAVTPPGLAVLNAIAACESGGNPTAVSPDGTYRGKYQFSFSTWASVGGSGDPAAAPEREQDIRAAILYNQLGSKPWPVCGV